MVDLVQVQMKNTMTVIPEPAQASISCGRFICVQFICSCFIPGNTCQCKRWEDCKWSAVAYEESKSLKVDCEKFEAIQLAFQQNKCGRPEQHQVYCCGLEQNPPTISIGMSYSILMIVLKDDSQKL